jgi:glutamate decarboxylase
VVAQYFNFLHLGRAGYERRMATLEAIACHLADGMAALPSLSLVSHPRGQLPVFAVQLDSSVRNWTVFQLSDRLRARGWLIPAYTMPADCEDMAVLRFVVRAGFSRDMADQLLVDIQRAVAWFESLPGPMPEPPGAVDQAFHH